MEFVRVVSPALPLMLRGSAGLGLLAGARVRLLVTVAEERRPSCAVGYPQGVDKSVDKFLR